HEARVELNLPVDSRSDNQARFGFATGAPIGIVVKADADIIDRQDTAQGSVDRVDCGPLYEPAADIRLIRDDNRQVACGTQPLKRLRNARSDLVLVQRPRGKRPALVNDSAVDDAVTVEENRAPHADDISGSSRGIRTSPPAVDWPPAPKKRLMMS